MTPSNTADSEGKAPLDFKPALQVLLATNTNELSFPIICKHLLTLSWCFNCGENQVGETQALRF